MAYGDTMNCPYCGEICEADWVDVGVGWDQCGPFHCVVCGASQIGPYDEPRILEEIEEKTKWYKPNSEPGSSANVINGRIVPAAIMREVYQEEFKGNILYHSKSYVKKWYEKIRKKR